MNATVRKGRSGLLETGAFIASFPLDPDPNKPLIITVPQFDEWAISKGFIPADVERDTRNADRNILRGKINNTAASPAWTNDGNHPFHIAVQDYGLSYKVAPTRDAFTVKARQLPVQMESLIKTKKGALDRLRSSVDVDQLPFELKLGVDQLSLEIECFAETMGVACGQLNRKFAAIQNGLVRAQITSANGGVAAVLSIDAKEG